MNKFNLCFLLVFFVFNTYGQQINNSQAISQKLLFQFNKDKYNTGDTLSFKCFVINSINHSKNDNNLYILLSNSKEEIISKERYPLINSAASGFISIPKDLESGLYYIEAFTPYLINNKRIKRNQIIINNPENKLKDFFINCKINTPNKIISSIPNSIFIKTEFKNEIPVSTKVILEDSDGNEVKKILTDLNGIAKLTFTPLRNKKYNLKVDNQSQIFPIVTDSVGINTELSFEKDVLNFNITKNFKIDKKQDSFTLVVYKKNEEVYKLPFSFDNYASVTSGVNISALNTGVIKVIVYDKDEVTLTSNSVYFENKKNFEEVVFKTNYNNTFNKVNEDLVFSSKSNKYLSISSNKVESRDLVTQNGLDIFYDYDFNNNNKAEIIDFFSTTNIEPENFIKSYIILFPNIKQALTNSTQTLSIDDDYAINIKGTVYESESEKILNNGILQFSYETNDSSYKYTANVKNDGSFTLDSLLFSGKQQFNYKYYNADKNEVNCLIKLNKDANSSNIDFVLKNSFGYKQTYINDNADSSNSPLKPKVLEDVKIKSSITQKSKKENINDLYTTGIYAGQSSEFIDNINNPNADIAMPAVQFIRNRIPILKIENGVFVNLRNFSLQSNLPTTHWVVGIMIDEVPASMAELNLITVSDIALVKFFDIGHATLGNINPGGLIALYTKGEKYGRLQSKKMNSVGGNNRRNQVLSYDGFKSNTNLFEKNERIYNKFNSVYWNPSIIIPYNQSNFNFEIDKIKPKDSYILSIIGYTDEGKYISISRFFKSE